MTEFISKILKVSLSNPTPLIFMSLLILFVKIFDIILHLKKYNGFIGNYSYSEETEKVISSLNTTNEEVIKKLLSYYNVSTKILSKKIVGAQVSPNGNMHFSDKMLKSKPSANSLETLCHELQHVLDKKLRIKHKYSLYIWVLSLILYFITNNILFGIIFLLNVYLEVYISVQMEQNAMDNTSKHLIIYLTKIECLKLNEVILNELRKDFDTCADEVKVWYTENLHCFNPAISTLILLIIIGVSMVKVILV